VTEYTDSGYLHSPVQCLGEREMELRAGNGVVQNAGARGVLL
jgi:hypothetical protein